MRWAEKRLDELGTVSRGRSRHRPRDAAHLYGGAYPFVQTGEIKQADLYLTQYSQTYSEAGLAQSRLWPANTLCITIAANIAETAILGMDACFPDSVIGFTADESRCDVRFIKYLFDTIKERYQQVSIGAAQQNLSQEKLLSFSVAAPPVETQRRIADVLSAYDTLIANNRRRMELLEESARRLYEEWFVRLRFPGHQHTRLIDGLPEGWKQTAVPEVVEINPVTPLTDAAEHAWVEMADLPLDSMVVQNCIQREGRSGSKFQNGDTLFARITPCLENGKTAFVNFLADAEVARGSTEFIVLRATTTLPPEFVYCLARTYAFRENAIKSMVGSSGRQRVQESCFEKFMVLVPSKPMLQQFSEFVVPVFRQVRILHKKNGRLRAARDLFLPRLMSGEIEV